VKPPRVGRRIALGGALASLALGSVAGGGAAAVAGCGGGSPRRTSTELRIVSISPSATEAVFALGRGDRLVGRSTYCDEPPEARAVPEVGGFADPSLERIVALSPTLVVGERGPAGPRLVEALESRGIATWFPPIGSLADIEAFLIGLGDRLDAKDAAAAAVARIRARAAEVDAAVAGRPRPRVLFLFDFAPIVAAGPGSFPDELLRRAGADNVVTRGGMYPRLGPEGVLALDPDAIVDGSAPGAYAEPPMALLRGIAGLDALRAVRAGRVARLEGTAALRPGPRIGDGLLQLSRVVAGFASAGSQGVAPR
jgi:iron complex transport system substrate-binding protein